MNLADLSGVQAMAMFMVSVASYEVLKLSVGLVFGRLTAPGFVKIKDCEQCAAKELRNDVKAIKRVLVVMATGGEVSEEDLKGLVN
ncbi:MAG: hypothetical protein OEV73_00115 [Desulfobulbaceae bacterium]|nr:hypothetical protein [Desulfobulbaceae bacterium]